MANNVGTAVKKVIQELVVPDLQEIKSDIRELKVEIRRLDEKIDSGLTRLDEKIDSKHNEVISEIRRMDERINSLNNKIELTLEFRERFAAIESKVAALSPR